MEAVFNKFIKNGEIYDTNAFDNTYNNISPSVYEVIRIIDKVPLFLEEHYSRLLNSIKLTGNEINISFDYIFENIKTLISLNNIESYNVKIVINNLHEKPDIYFYFIKSSYPESYMYNKGIDTLLYKAVRENPHAKIINSNLRNDVNKLLSERNCYEALLVNNKDEITEGSRSNTFFIKGSEVYTPPAGEVLLGITRQRIIRLLKENNIEIKEIPIKTEDLKTFDSAFISGTSPKVLPIKKIDLIELDMNNPILKKIIEIYNKAIEEYIKEHC